MASDRDDPRAPAAQGRVSRIFPVPPTRSVPVGGTPWSWLPMTGGPALPASAGPLPRPFSVEAIMPGPAGTAAARSPPALAQGARDPPAGACQVRRR